MAICSIAKVSHHQRVRYSSLFVSSSHPHLLPSSGIPGIPGIPGICQLCSVYAGQLGVEQMELHLSKGIPVAGVAAMEWRYWHQNLSSYIEAYKIVHIQWYMGQQMLCNYTYNGI